MSRIVWVTGASQGIGAALARELAGRGNTVIASARSEGGLADLAGRHPGRIVPLPLDVTDQTAVRAAVGRIEREHGGIDVAVLNAGTHQPVAARAFTKEGLARLIDLNLLGTAGCIEAVLPAMLARGQGHVAVVGSVAGYRGLPTSAYYGASKAALINMCEALRFDLEPAGIKLQLVSPGFVRTPLTDKNSFPMPFLMESDDAVRRLADGLDGDAFEIAFPRRFAAILKVARILPYRLYFALARRLVQS